MQLSTSAIGPASQSIKLVALMAFIVVYFPINLLECSIVLEQSSAQRGCHPVPDDLALNSVPVMPRLRGRPRRGAGWYAAASRWKRHREFQSAVTLARRRRRQAIRATGSPLGTIVEEDSSIQLPPDFSDKKMVTFPDDWESHTRVFRSGITPPGRTSSDSCAKASSDLGTEPYIIEEEQWMDVGAAQDAECLGRDDKQTRPPSPPLLLPEQLQLIFEVRSMVEDQIFRVVYASQRLDMLYAAYSNDSPKRLFPTCAQPFAIPVRAAEAQDDKASPG
jgi:hypothetical protein